MITFTVKLNLQEYVYLAAALEQYEGGGTPSLSAKLSAAALRAIRKGEKDGQSSAPSEAAT